MGPMSITRIRHSKVHGWCLSDRKHHWQGWKGLQEGGGQSSVRVWGQKPHPHMLQMKEIIVGMRKERRSDWSSSSRSFKWRGWASLNTELSVTVRTPFGHLTAHSRLAGLNSGCTSWGGWGSLIRHLKSSATSSCTIIIWYANASAMGPSYF